MGISLQQGWQQLSDIPVLCLELGQQHCVVSLYGSHVLRYFDGSCERLWLSDTATWTNAAAIRGGIPICWPWFGPYPQSQVTPATALPNHGLVRNRLWNLEGFDITDSSVQATLAIVVSDIPWHHSNVTLRCHVTLNNEGLSVCLQSDQELMQQAALHSYFSVTSLADASVSGLSSQYSDKVNQSQEIAHHGQCRFIGEIDRIYPNTADTLTLNTGTTWQLHQDGHDASVVWNPGEHKGSNAKDIQQQWPEFICVETAQLNWQPKGLKLTQQIPKL